MKLEVCFLPRKTDADIVVLVDVLGISTIGSIFFDKGGEYIGDIQHEIHLDKQLCTLLDLDDSKIQIEAFLKQEKISKTAVLKNEHFWQTIDLLKKGDNQLKHGSKTILLGSFYNAKSVRETVLQLIKPDSVVSLMCLGFNGEESLGNIVCSGLLAKTISQNSKYLTKTSDCCLVAENILTNFPDPQEALAISAAGIDLLNNGYQENLAYASLISQSQSVPVFKQDGFYIYA